MDGTTRQNPKRVKDSSERRWEDLPVNCLVAIFSRLGLDDMTLSIPFVCKFWHEASLDPTCWKVLDFRVTNPSPGSPFSEQFKHEYHVNNYTFRGFLKFVANRSHKLATKVILPVGRLPFSDMVYICKECPMLNITWQPECNSNLIRRFILRLHETMLRSNSITHDELQPDIARSFTYSCCSEHSVAANFFCAYDAVNSEDSYLLFPLQSSYNCFAIENVVETQNWEEEEV